MERAHVFDLFAASDGIVNKIWSSNSPIKIPPNETYFLVLSVRVSGLSARFLTSMQASVNICGLRRCRGYILLRFIFWFKKPGLMHARANELISRDEGIHRLCLSPMRRPHSETVEHIITEAQKSTNSPKPKKASTESTRRGHGLRLLRMALRQNSHLTILVMRKTSSSTQA